VFDINRAWESLQRPEFSLFCVIMLMTPCNSGVASGSTLNVINSHLKNYFTSPEYLTPSTVCSEPLSFVLPQWKWNWASL
jgi:hypothetical protein